ncbi:ABC transporter substrate-binding protein [Desulfovirgula thermocuniculi]|uniref:ABC transporter substrate-binding protein n=1 Tax=Desulfovirgula thermocuniculi TaxID=348842 RepID=UPI00042249F3|nr:ABC transporter substrate-binding protein [Desulfovirgula thermocuniculi]
MRRLMLVLALVLAVCAAGGCARQGTATKQPEALKIGVLAPLTGPFASGGASMKQSLELAREEVNAKGGVLGRPVELIFADSQGKADAARAEALRLLEKEKVQLLIGAYLSEETAEVMELAAAKKVPLIIPVAAATEFTAKVRDDYDKYKYVFRVAYNIDQWAELLGSFMAGQGIKNYAFVGVNIRWNQEFAQALKNYLARYGITPVYEGYYASKDPALDGIVNALKEKRPAMVVLGDPGKGAVEMVKKIQDYQLGVPVLSVGGSLGDARVAATLTGKSPVYFQAAGWKNTEKGARYFETFKARYGYQPVGYSDVLPYDALLVLAQGVNRAGSLEAEKVIKALEEGKLEGLCGTYNFDRSHQAQWGPGKGLAGVVVEWREGKDVVR